MNEISNNEAMATIDMNALYERCDATIAQLWDKFFGFERSDNPNDWVKNPENYDVDLKLFIAVCYTNWKGIASRGKDVARFMPL